MVKVIRAIGHPHKRTNFLDIQGKCGVLWQSLFPANVSLPANWLPPTSDNSDTSITVTALEIGTTLCHWRTVSPIGVDNVSYPMLAAIHKDNPLILPKPLSSLLRFGAFPEPWKINSCHPIRKPEGRDTSIPKNLRSIAVLSCLSKRF